ncbi:MAG: PQQ-binding-like beta-propeller repeat protein [Anaeromyxobacteraceae bacterium]
MIRIRTGQAWRHDPRLRESLRGGGAGALAARAVVDALAIEVDGFDIAGGRAEAELLPALEGLLRAVGAVVGGAPVATVPFRDGALEVVLRRRGAEALLTVVELAVPSRVLARDVAVELEELAAAALEASADFLRDLAALAPAASGPGGRALRAAARDLRRAGPGAAQPGPPRAARARPGGAAQAAPGVAEPSPPPSPGRPHCRVELHDDEGLVLAYEGGRPDLGSLLAPGRVSLTAADGTPLAAWTGMPFLALRDLGAASTRLLAAVRARATAAELALPRGGGPASLGFDLATGTARPPGKAASPCPPLELVRAIAEAASGFARHARRQNPRQAENGQLAELENAAADRLAQADELGRGDVEAVGPGGEPPGGAPPPRGVPQRALGPGRLRRLAFRRTFALEVGRPAGAGILAARGPGSARRLIVAGRARVAAVDRSRGTVAWSVEGADGAWAVPGGVAAARGDLLAVHDLATGVLRLEARLDARPAAVLAPEGGPLVVVAPEGLLALDAATGEVRWRFEAPGAHRLHAAALGPLVVAGADTGFLYGLDAGGRVAFRVLGPGPVLRPCVAWMGAWLATCSAPAGGAVLALEEGRGRRLWEAPLDFAPASAPVGWGRRIAIAGGHAGDAMVAVLTAAGAPEWVDSPALAGAPTLAPAGNLLLARGPDGALVALGRDGRPRWSRAGAPGGHAPPSVAPVVVRGTVLAPGEGIAVLSAATGEPLGALPGLAPARLVADGALSVVALDADGRAAGYRLATHLSVV